MGTLGPSLVHIMGRRQVTGRGRAWGVAAAERRVTYLPGSFASRSMSISQRHPSLCWTERAAGNAAHLRARVAGPCASSAAAQGRTYIAYSSPYAVQLIVIGKRLIDSG